MTVEQRIAALHAEGWIVQRIGETTRGEWTVVLLHPEMERNSSGARGICGMDRACWRVGRGATLPAAISAASSAVAQNQPVMEDHLDLAALLG